VMAERHRRSQNWSRWQHGQYSRRQSRHR
jgi:hypothetical protein